VAESYDQFAPHFDAWQRAFGGAYDDLILPRLLAALGRHPRPVRRVADLGIGTGVVGRSICAGGTDRVKHHRHGCNPVVDHPDLQWRRRHHSLHRGVPRRFGNSLADGYGHRPDKEQKNHRSGEQRRLRVPRHRSEQCRQLTSLGHVNTDHSHRTPEPTTGTLGF
jgi:hypothetical protein